MITVYLPTYLSTYLHIYLPTSCVDTHPGLLFLSLSPAVVETLTLVPVISEDSNNSLGVTAGLS
jgi:hypothetical protein